jgi:outer membrane autotransporter protein
VAHRFDLGATSLTPFARAAWVYNWAEGFTETGGAAALTTSASSDQALLTTFGLRAEHEITLPGGGKALLNGSLGWRHAFSDTASVTNSFASGDSFTVFGTPLASDALLVSAGAEIELAPNASLELSYSGEFSGSSTDHAISAMFRMEF